MLLQIFILKYYINMRKYKLNQNIDKNNNLKKKKSWLM